MKGNWQAQFTLEALKRLNIQLGNIDLMYCQNDEMALAVNEYLLEKKLKKVSDSGD